MAVDRYLKNAWRRLPLTAIWLIAAVAVMVLLLCSNVTRSHQSMPAKCPDIFFEGQYRIGSGPWADVIPGQHISSTRGDITLQGLFHIVSPTGEDLGPVGKGVPLVFYTNHVHLTIQETGMRPHALDTERGFPGEDFCGKHCDSYTLMTHAPVTITIHNPHRFGNETAVDEFLQELAVYTGPSVERSFNAQGFPERILGLVFVITAFALLGTALFSMLLRIKGIEMLWPIGLSVLFAGGYFTYGAKGVFFWSNSIIGNTTILGACMMLYMLCASLLITLCLSHNLQRIGNRIVIGMAVFCTALALVSLTTPIRFYDTWLWWAVLQSLSNVLFLICLVLDFPGVPHDRQACYIGAIVFLVSFELDTAATYLGWWQGGRISRQVFVGLFVVAVVLVWRVVPRSINAAMQAKELAAEQKELRAQLQERRIAIMISQIQPHFIYNTLGTIQQLCLEDPKQASDLIHSFTLYLRGNFSELDSTAPIRFSRELEHIRCYTDIELVRFPDMSVVYDISAADFLLPALTVQPLVENAIKHGLMGLEQGGTVKISSFETDSHYCIMVEDDGVGFDPAQQQDNKRHIGIRNVRERLQTMCGGSLFVKSAPGNGTCARIEIPKEGPHT